MVVVLASCFDTRLDDTEEKRMRRIRDSIHTDSVNMRRNTPDTTLATFKRTAVCDGQLMVTFDRVKMLSGTEAEEYAKRHKRFGNALNVIVNQEVTLETLPLADEARVLLMVNPVRTYDDKDAPSDVHVDSGSIITEVVGGDTIPYRRGRGAELSKRIAQEEIVQIVVLHRSIVYLKQLPPSE